MKNRSSIIHRPLNKVFSAPGHIAILRALVHSREGMSGRAVARQAGINHQACADGLVRLETIGIVLRQGSGKTQLFSLNRRHYIVEEILLPLLKRENELVRQLIRILAQGLGPHSLSLTVFGSVARGEETLESDFDLLVVVKGEKAKKAAQRAGDALGTELLWSFGIRLSPVYLTLEGLRRSRRRREQLIESIIETGRTINGIPILELTGNGQGQPDTG